MARQVNAIKTILVEEEFGDWNEKVFEDVRNFDEVWEWIEGALFCNAARRDNAA